MVIDVSGAAGGSADRFSVHSRHRGETQALQGISQAMTAYDAALIGSDYSSPCPSTIRDNILLKWKIVAEGLEPSSLDFWKIV
jgi:hypothetical protein